MGGGQVLMSLSLALAIAIWVYYTLWIVVTVGVLSVLFIGGRFGCNLV
jgi:hypothetical protein